MANVLTQRRIVNRDVDSNFADVQFLLGFNGNDNSTVARDESRLDQVVTFSGDAKIVTDQSYFGGGSLRLDGTGDFISVPAASLPGDFTLECWIRWAATSAFATIFAGTTANTQVFLSLKGDGTGLRAGRTGVAEYANGSFSWTLNKWYHIACVRCSGAWKLFVDGTDITTGTPTNSFNYSGVFRVGLNESGSFGVNCNIDEMRATAAARYFATFSPPQRRFPRGQ